MLFWWVCHMQTSILVSFVMHLLLWLCLITCIDYSNVISDILIRVISPYSLAMIMKLHIHVVLWNGYATIHQYCCICISFMLSQVYIYDIVHLDIKIGVWSLMLFTNYIVRNIKFMLRRLNYIWDTILVNLITYVNSTLSQY